MPSITMTVQQMTCQPKELRSAVQRDGEVVALTRYGKPYAYVVPANQWHQIMHELEQDEAEGGAV